MSLYKFETLNKTVLEDIYIVSSWVPDMLLGCVACSGEG